MAQGYPAVHERVLWPLEQRGVRGPRERLLARAFGRVVEVGGGTGEHLALYAPETVERVTVVGPDIWTRAMVERRARAAAVPVDLVDERLPAGLEEGTVNVIVVSYLLCALSDRHTLLTEARRLLNDDGLLLFVEHVPSRLARGVLGDLAAPAWRAATAGCDLKSDPLAAIRGAGFTIVDLERFVMPTLQLPLRSCVAGVAR